MRLLAWLLSIPILLDVGSSTLANAASTPMPKRDGEQRDDAQGEEAVQTFAIGVGPSFVAPSGKIDRQSMRQQALPGVGLQLDGLFRMSREGAFGIALEGVWLQGPDDVALGKTFKVDRQAFGIRPAIVAEICFMTTIAPMMPPRVRLGVGYRWLFVHDHPVGDGGDFRGIPFTPNNTFSGPELLLEAGFAIPLPHVRIDPGFQLGVARMWHEGADSSKDDDLLLSLFLSLGVRGVFDVTRLDRSKDRSSSD